MLRPYLALITVACVLGAQSALAQSIAEPGKQLVLELGPGGLTKEFAEIIGRYGERSAFKATEDQTIGAIVSSACGGLQESFIRAVQVANGNDALQYGTTIKSRDVLLLPPCPPETGYVLAPQKVADGDRAYNYYVDFSKTDAGKQLNFYDESIKADMAKINDELQAITDRAIQLKEAQKAADTSAHQTTPETPATPSTPQPKPIPIDAKLFTNNTSWITLFAAANRDIRQPGSLHLNQVVVLPMQQDGVQYVLPLDKATPADALKFASTALNLAAIAGRAVKNTKLVNGFWFFSSVANADCKPSRKFDEAYQNRVLRVLVDDLSLTGTPPSVVHPALVLLDSGVYDFAKIPGRPSTKGLVAPYTPSVGQFEPFGELTEAPHGTGVLTLSIGGIGIASDAAAIGYRYDVQPINIFKKKTEAAFDDSGHQLFDADGTPRVATQYDLDNDKIIPALENSGPAVINMSFGRDTQIDSLMRHLQSAEHTLYVVAAGNDGKTLDERPLYPGKNGGEKSPNLLTVASVDGNNQLSKFSNKGNEYVEIAAPGCQVPTLSYDKNMEALVAMPMTGTSFSAPQVSWVASMVRALIGPSTGSVIKARILIGADNVTGLTRDVKEGRVLNPIKTLSLTKDAVEIVQRPRSSSDDTDNSPSTAADLPRDDQQEIVRGIISTEPDAAQFCDASDVPIVSGSRLAKVVRNFDGKDAADGTNRLYFVDQNGEVRGRDCKARDFSVDLRTDDTSAIRTITANQIVDITYRWPQ